jgi:hypothetical protein
MKLWLGGEIDGSAYDQFRPLRNEIEKTVNSKITDLDCGEANKWNVIVILRNDDVYPEVVKFNKKGMDIRLQLSLSEFLVTDVKGQKAMIVDLLVRSLELVSEQYSKIAKIGEVKSIVKNNV